MKNREQLVLETKSNNEKILALQAANEALKIEWYQLCDEKGRYSESEEVWGRGKKKETHMVGRRYWSQDFKDEDTGDVVAIERSQCVRIDGIWQL